MGDRRKAWCTLGLHEVVLTCTPVTSAITQRRTPLTQQRLQLHPGCQVRTLCTKVPTYHLPLFEPYHRHASNARDSCSVSQPQRSLPSEPVSRVACVVLLSRERDNDGAEAHGGSVGAVARMATVVCNCFGGGSLGTKCVSGGRGSSGCRQGCCQK
eukprot:1151767-Pelagomonas_calceolata.AAC.2